MNAKALILELRSKTKRQNAILVLNGMGVNFWHYQCLFRHFSVEELQDFRAIYAISGAAGGLWFHLLSQENGVNDDQMKNVDSLLRTTLNGLSLTKRIFNLIRRDFLYDTSDLVKFISFLIASRFTVQLFKELPLSNFIVVAHEDKKNSLLLLNRESHPGLPVLGALCSAGYPRKIQGRPFCKARELEGLSISDFQFAPSEVKKQFKVHLESTHRGQRIYQINILKSQERGATQFVKVCADSHPKLGQLIDFLSAVLNLPNTRPYKTYRTSIDP